MQAMILAAGFGTRMRPLTDHTPKPLLPVAGKPLLEYQLERLLQAGVSRVVINTSYLAEQIETFIRAKTWPVPILLSHEDSPLETAGGVQCALDRRLLDPNEPLLLVNGDIWCDLPLEQLPELADGQSAYLILVDNPAHNPNGDFQLRDNQQVFSQQKTTNAEGTPGLVKALTFSGISLLNPALIPEPAACPPPLKLGPLLKAAADQGLVRGCHYRGFWLDVGTPERLHQLEERLTVLNNAAPVPSH